MGLLGVTDFLTYQVFGEIGIVTGIFAFVGNILFGIQTGSLIAAALSFVLSLFIFWLVGSYFWYRKMIKNEIH